MPLSLKHVVAEASVIHHVITFNKVPESEDFRNIYIFRAGQALIAKSAQTGDLLQLNIHCLFDLGKLLIRVFFHIQKGQVLGEVMGFVHAHAQCSDLGMGQAKLPVELDSGIGLAKALDFCRRLP